MLYNTSSSQSSALVDIAMESNDEQWEDDYVDGPDADFDKSMMETMFEWSAYVSTNDENDDDNDVGSDDDENNNANAKPVRR